MTVSSFSFTNLFAMKMTQIICPTEDQSFENVLATCERTFTKLNVLYLKKSKLYITGTVTSEEKMQARQEIMNLKASTQMQTSLRVLKTFRERSRVVRITKMYLATWIDKLDKKIEQLQQMPSRSHEQKLAKIKKKKSKL